MREERTGLLELHVTYSFMAAVAVTLDRKGSLGIMAPSAGISGLHLLHGIPLCVGPCDKKSAVTVVATELLQMKRMTERVCDGKRDIFDNMTADAIALHRETVLAVVAG